MVDSLVAYVREYKSKGYSERQLRDYLLSLGYRKEDVERAVRNSFPGKARILPIIIFAVLLAVSGSALFFFMSRPVCGNGILESGEDIHSCCADAGCYGEMTCKDNICVDPICSDCQYLQDHVCKSYECCSDSDCIDTKASTRDYCMIDKKICNHVLIQDCINDDGYCPPFCIASTDNDCSEVEYRFRRYDLSFMYLPSWNLFDYVLSKQIVLTQGESGIIMTVEDMDEEIGIDELADHLKNMIESSGIEITRVRQVSILNSPAIEFILKQDEVYIHKTLTILDGRAYTFDVFSPENEYKSFLPKASSVLQSAMHEQAAYEKTDNPFLWRIGDNSYLYGTIHVNIPAVLDLPDKVDEAIRNSDAVYTELIMDDFSFSKIALNSFLPTGESISSLLSPAEYEEYTNFLVLKGIEPLAFEQMKPWLIAISLSSLGKEQTNEGYVLDSLVSGIASENLKDIGAIETVDEQIAVFDSLSKEEQKEFLMSTIRLLLKHHHIGESGEYDLVKGYLAGDADILMESVTEGFDFDDPLSVKLYDNLIIARNRQMAERIINKMQDNPERRHFFAFGVAHMWGKDGIIDILTSRGYKVERVQ